VRALEKAFEANESFEGNCMAVYLLSRGRKYKKKGSATSALKIYRPKK
jgi:hypothetical protein